MQFMWASQAKVQCGIAIGYLKSGFKDPVSIGKCVDAHARMQMLPPPPPPPPLPQSPLCDESIAGLVFFEWDSAVPPADAASTIDSVVTSVQSCQWTGLVVIGHTDRSGSDAYNDALSMRRANAVADLLASKGVAVGQMTVSGRGEAENRVPTADGVRELQNRRVEVAVEQ
jgi:outer membrane protein OmpA-like peptidoglycan-associated protein